jgi:hypothetical protein
MADQKTPDNTGGADAPPASDPAVSLDQDRPVPPDQEQRPGQRPAAERQPAETERQPAAAEHPRRLRPPRGRPADKQLRPDRVRGGFDTKD